MSNSLSSRMRDIAAKAPVIPVLTIERLEDAAPLAQALVSGGLPALEITLRTEVALDAISAIAEQVEGAKVGAGTVIEPSLMEKAKKAGAEFAVAPGATPALMDAADAEDMPFLPGAATASEAMAAAERGYEFLKLFPAEPVGGLALLKALAAPLPEIAWCPTGGLSDRTARDYLALPSVLCVGGSWLAPKEALRAKDWERIEKLARIAAGWAG